MKLSYYCKSCSVKNYLTTNATNRFDLQRELGAAEISKRCRNCGTIQKRHINRLHAEPNKIYFLICIPLILILSIIVYFLGFIATLTFSIPIALVFQAQKKASDFNKTMIPRK